MPDKCPGCPAPSADMDGFIVSGPGGAPRSEGSGVSSSEGPFVQEAPQTGHVIIMGTLGADGNPGSLPDVPQVGWAYVAEDAGTYGGVQATEGDMVYCTSLNPVRWGVLQADSDDSGRDLVSVSASFECVSMESYAPYGPVAEIAVYDSGMNVLGRSNLISAPGGLLEVPPLRDVSWQLRDPDFSAVAFVSVMFTSAEYAGDLLSIYERRVSMPSWTSLEAGALLECETSCSVECLGPDRCALRVESASAAGGRTFQILAARGPALSLTSVKASGASSVQTVDMSCLNARYGALDSVSASFSCDADSYEPDYCGFFGYDYAGDSLVPLPDVSYSLSGNTLSFSWLSDAHQHAVIVFDSIFTADISVFTASEGDSFDAYSENPFVSVHMLLDSVSYSGGVYSFVFRLTVGRPNPVLSLTSAKADGTSSSQDVDMSCLVQPVFDGSVNGLVPVHGAVYNYLLAGDGTWMRPVTNAEIDALFAEEV